MKGDAFIPSIINQSEKIYERSSPSHHQKGCIHSVNHQPSCSAFLHEHRQHSTSRARTATCTDTHPHTPKDTHPHTLEDTHPHPLKFACFLSEQAPCSLSKVLASAATLEEEAPAGALRVLDCSSCGKKLPLPHLTPGWSTVGSAIRGCAGEVSSSAAIAAMFEFACEHMMMLLCVRTCLVSTTLHVRCIYVPMGSVTVPFSCG